MLDRSRATMLSDEHGKGDDQRPGPGELLPVGIGRQRELEDGDRQAGHRRVRVKAPELVVERREEKRRRLAGNPGDRQQDTGDDAGAGGAIADAHDHFPARRAERGCRFAQRVGDEGEHVLGGAHDHRNDQHGQRDAACPSREVAHPDDQDLVDEQADDDRGRREQDVVDEADDEGEPGIAAILGHVGTGENPDRACRSPRRKRSASGCRRWRWQGRPHSRAAACSR